MRRSILGRRSIPTRVELTQQQHQHHHFLESELGELLEGAAARVLAPHSFAKDVQPMGGRHYQVRGASQAHSAAPVGAS